MQLTARLVAGGWKWLVAVVGVLTAMISVYSFARGNIWPLLAPPTPMDGDFNVAIAEFTASGVDDGQADATLAGQLADSVHERLAEELDGLEAVIERLRLRPPEETGRISGSSAEERAQAAERLATAINADVVLYGDLLFSATQATFVPELYLSDRLLKGAEELAGEYPFDPTVVGDLASNLIARQQLRNQLLDQMRGLTHVVAGLGYYSLGKYKPAREQFEAADQADVWGNRGRATVSLFLGNTTLKLDEPDVAATYYRQSLAHEPGYTRARFGLAEVRFHQVRGDCTPDATNVKGLREAARLYAAARDAAVQPERAFIKLKSTWGLGRVQLCLLRAGASDGAEQAETDFETVIAAYEGGNEQVQEIAAESHAFLGLLALMQTAGDRHARLDALEHYEAAVATAVKPERKAFFWSEIGRVQGLLGDYDSAEAAYTRAIELHPDAEQRDLYARLVQELQQKAEAH